MNKGVHHLLGEQLQKLIRDTDNSQSLLGYRTALLLEKVYCRMCVLEAEVDELKKEKCYVD